MHEIHLMAETYHLDPIDLVGLDRNQETPLLIWQMRRAIFYAGRGVENRLKQTHLELVEAQQPAPKGMVWNQILTWTYEQAVGLHPRPEHEDDVNSITAMAERAQLVQRDLDPEKASLLRGLVG